jgi:hypothetical protein
MHGFLMFQLLSASREGVEQIRWSISQSVMGQAEMLSRGSSSVNGEWYSVEG